MVCVCARMHANTYAMTCLWRPEDILSDFYMDSEANTREVRLLWQTYWLTEQSASSCPGSQFPHRCISHTYTSSSSVGICGVGRDTWAEGERLNNHAELKRWGLVLTWASDIHVQHSHLLLCLRRGERQGRSPADVCSFKVLLSPLATINEVIFWEQSLVFSLDRENSFPSLARVLLKLQTGAEERQSPTISFSLHSVFLLLPL